MTRNLVKAEPLFGFFCACGVLNHGPLSALTNDSMTRCNRCSKWHTVFVDLCPACDPNFSHFGGCEHSKCNCTKPQCIVERTSTVKVVDDEVLPVGTTK